MKENAYQRLLKITEGNSKTIIDNNIMLALARIEASEYDVETTPVPMSARIKEGGLEEIEKHAKALSIIGNIVVLTATPKQLLELIYKPEVISLELSR